MKDTLGENGVVVKWDGWDNKLMRPWVGKQMAAAISGYAKQHPGEEIKIVYPSHGWTVAFNTLVGLNHGVQINGQVTLGVPVRDDFRPKEEKIRQHVNVYTKYDLVQINGGKQPIDPGISPLEMSGGPGLQRPTGAEPGCFAICQQRWQKHFRD